MSRVVLDCHDKFGGGTERIRTEFHRYCSCMAGPAKKPKRFSGLARNAGDYGKRQILLLQHRPLLDVDFHVTKQTICVQARDGERVGMSPEAPNCLCHRNAVCVGALQFFRVKGSR